MEPLRVHIAGISPRLKARIAGAFYAVTVVTSLYGYFIARGTPTGHAANLVAGAAYLVVTALLYDLLKPVNPTVSLLAAFFSLEGVAHQEHSLFFFGFYCVLLGYLIYESTFFPRALGVVTALAGLGLLTNDLTKLLVPSAAKAVSVYGFTLDVGEIALMLWLLIVGLNAAKWQESANRSTG